MSAGTLADKGPGAELTFLLLNGLLQLRPWNFRECEVYFWGKGESFKGSNTNLLYYSKVENFQIREFKTNKQKNPPIILLPEITTVDIWVFAFPLHFPFFSIARIYWIIE